MTFEEEYRAVSDDSKPTPFVTLVLFLLELD